MPMMLAGILVLILALLAPLAAVWALNILFPILAIPYTFETWLAVIVLASVFRARTPEKK